MSPEREAADIDFAAGVKARKLCFREEPERQSEFWGGVSRRSFSEVRRRNVPNKVRKGVEYHDASLRWEARGWVEEAESEDGKNKRKEE